jgi:hypothetical protein
VLKRGLGLHRMGRAPSLGLEQQLPYNSEFSVLGKNRSHNNGQALAPAPRRGAAVSRARPQHGCPRCHSGGGGR